MNREDAKRKYGENLRKIRISKGMSQEELAKALGYTNRSSINKIEIGRSNIPTDKIARTAEVLGVSPLELFNIDDDVKQEIEDVASDAGSNKPEDILSKGSYHDSPDIGKIKSMIFSGDIQKLTEPNQARLMSYYQALLDSQEDDNDEQS